MLKINYHRPHYEEHLIGFIDILGYSSLMSSHDDQRKAEVLSYQTSIASMEKGGYFEMNEHGTTKRPNIALLSDTIIYSIPVKDHEHGNLFNPLWSILYNIVEVQLRFLAKGLLTRGSVTIGPIYNYENCVFGEGLVTAAKLEKSAKFPMVILDKNVLEKFPLNDKERYFIRTTKNGKIVTDPFCYAGEGVKNLKSTLDDFQDMLDYFRSVIVTNIHLNMTDENNLLKWRWIAAYFQQAITKFSDDTTLKKYFDPCTLKISIPEKQLINYNFC